MNKPSLAIFALNASRDFGRNVCGHLNTRLSEHEERDFEDGEHKARPLENVRGRDVFVIHSLYGDVQQSVNDKLCRLLFFIGALRDASAARVTAVMPYLCYARKDRKTKPRDPVTTRYIAGMFEAAGAGRAITLDVHNLAAYQNAWRMPTDHLEARKLFVDHFVPICHGRDVTVISPDVGGAKRVEDFRQALAKALSRDVSSGFVEKYRSAGVVSGETLAGDVSGKTAIIIDDLISSGTTLARAAETCRSKGAVAVHAAATHGLFSSKADEVLANSALDSIVITNSVPVHPAGLHRIQDKITVLDAASLFAEAIQRIHSGGSIVDLVAT